MMMVLSYLMKNKYHEEKNVSTKNASKEVCQGAGVREKHVYRSGYQTTGEDHCLKAATKSFESCKVQILLGTIITNQNLHSRRNLDLVTFRST